MGHFLEFGWGRLGITEDSILGRGQGHPGGLLWLDNVAIAWAFLLDPLDLRVKIFSRYIRASASQVRGFKNIKLPIVLFLMFQCL